MPQQGEIRIGFIGAGSIARSRHLPNLAGIPGARVVAVSNRTRDSAERVAGVFHIPEVVNDWHSLIARPELDAVFIGTWPYMHREMSVAALEAGKHVFCQARMAMDLAEARAMVEAARARPHLVAMVCPPPTRMPFEPFIREVLDTGRLGTITSVELVSYSGANLSRESVHWRERVEYSGRQIMAVGIYAETLNAWVGPYESLLAQLATPIPRKRDEDGREVEIEVPQVVTITGRLRRGALSVEHHLGLATDKTTQGTDRLTVWGLEGTLRYTFGQTLEMARPGEPLRPVEVPAGKRREWWVEEEFVSAVRDARAGRPWRVTPDFNEALLYMAKMEAVHRSAAAGRLVRLDEL